MKVVSQIRRLVLSMSERTEFWLVLLVAFGMATWNSFAFARSGAQVIISDGSRLRSSAIQLAILGFVVWIGGVRGWSIKELGVHLSWRLTAMGFLLFFAIFLILVPVGIGISTLVPPSFYPPPTAPVGLSFIGIFATIIINPFFEETLVCGYIVQRLTKNGAGIAVGFSAVVRVLYHVDQGPHSLGILLSGLIFGCLYWRYRELWPLIIAHFLINLSYLLALIAIS